MRTIKVILILAFLALPLVSFAQQGNDNAIILTKKDLPESNEQKSGPTISIDCYLMSDCSLLDIQSSAYLPSAVVVLENINTGAQTQNVINLSPMSSSYVAVPSSGDYNIYILLTDGTTYYGVFTL